MVITLVLSFSIAFLLTYLSIPPTVRVAVAKNLFDEPNHRKLNKTVVPTLGGVAIFLGLSLSSVLFMTNTVGAEMRILFAAVIMMLFIGLKDDLLAISAWKKLAVQITAALFLVLIGGFRVTNLFGLGGIEQMPEWAGMVISTAIIIFLVNAFNLIDGVDGLAAGLALIISAALGSWFYLAGHINFSVVCFALSGSLIAFLRFNLWGRKNKIFMGDTGSLVIGIFLAAMVLKFVEFNLTTEGPLHMKQAPLVALALFIVPITDTLRVFAIRVWHKRSPFSADMNHIHHLLVKLGMGHIQVSSFLVAYTLLFISLASNVQQHLNVTLGFVLLLSLSFSLVGLVYLNCKVARKKASLQPKMVLLKTYKPEKDQQNGYNSIEKAAMRKIT
jgi:UDP-N-acetylmuramyl pentapeptide phosphotransferase/UDP-N-acetylglucosamine-1-phosphate transferase